MKKQICSFPNLLRVRLIAVFVLAFVCISCSPPRFSYVIINNSGAEVEIEYSLFVRYSSITDEELYPKQMDSADFGDFTKSWQKLSSEEYSWEIEEVPPRGEPGTVEYANPDRIYHIKVKLQPLKTLYLLADTQPELSSGGISLSKFRVNVPSRRSNVESSSPKEYVQNDLQQAIPVINCQNMNCKTMFGAYRKSRLALDTAYVVLLPTP